MSTDKSRSTSFATAANTSSGGAPCATSVATRRSAACSSASRASPARVSAFATAVATRSVNWASRGSVSAGIGSSRLQPAAITPQRRPSTVIGVPIAERTPVSRVGVPIGPEASS